MSIGIVGIGRMGEAIAGRLLSFGNEVMVWNRAAEKTKSLAVAGAQVAATPAQLATASEIVITILTDAAAIDAVYHGKNGLLMGDVAGKCFIDMSTVRPTTQQALAAKVRAQGAAFVECPVGGTVEAARNGKLLGFVGGDAGDVARVRPILDQLCRRVEHVGPIGAGASMKLAVNLPAHVYWQALGEALSLCKPLGLDPARLLDILADTSGAPNFLKARTSVITAALKGMDTGPITFDVDSIRKDLQTMIDEAQSLGGTLPLVECALGCYDEAARDGLGGDNAPTLPARWLRRSEPA